MKKLGVVVLGYGFMGTTHLAAWRMLEDCVVLGLWGRDKGKLGEVAARYGVQPVHDLDVVWRDDRVDIIDVCTPTHTHKELTVKALEAGKNVLVEKPMALTLKEADEMIRASSTTGGKLMVAHVLRFFPEYMKAKELIDKGMVGEISSIRAWRGGPAPEWSPWFMDREKSGGVVVDLAVHDVDYAIWLNGGAPTRIYAKVENLLHRGYNIHDFALITLRFPSGSIALIESNWALPKTYPFTMKLEVDGSSGVIQLDNQSPTPMRMWTREGVEGFSPETLPWRPGVHPFPLDPFHREISHFVECVREDRRPLTDGEEAKKSLAVCLAAVESSERGAPVDLGG